MILKVFTIQIVNSLGFFILPFGCKYSSFDLFWLVLNMKIVYFLFWLIFNVGLRVFFKAVRTFNFKQRELGRTIFVSNHPAAFMDPLVIALFGKNIVHFMARADVFKPILKPIFSAAHMLPIYRQLDGGDTQEKNRLVFLKTSEILRKNKNILIFGEGFTDEVFIRRLKPIKKGAFRIGFTALEVMNWEHNVYVNAIGCNYTEPNMALSELLISSGDRICLNDYREQYEQNPSGTITMLTRMLEQDMKNQITHVENMEWLEFHEQCMMLTRKGMDPICYDVKYTLEDRHFYSQELAKVLNEKSADQLEQLTGVRQEVKDYFSSLAAINISENERFLHATSSWNLKNKVIKILLCLPFALLGIIHVGLFYFFIKRFVEKVFIRPVFWGSSKLIILIAVVGLFNIPFIFLIANYFSCLGSTYAFLIGFTYYFFIWFYGLVAFYFKNDIHYCYRYLKTRKVDLFNYNATAERLANSLKSI